MNWVGDSQGTIVKPEGKCPINFFMYLNKAFTSASEGKEY